MSGQEELPSKRRSSPGRTVDARQLWSGGAIMHLLLVAAPRPQMFVTWIIGLEVGRGDRCSWKRPMQGMTEDV